MINNENLYARSSGPAANRVAFTVRETAEMLGVKPRTVYRLLKRGKLRAAGALRHKIIPRTEIDAFLK